MKKLDIEKIKAQVGLSKEEFASEMGISLNELHLYCEGAPISSADLLGRMCQYTGLPPVPGGIFQSENPTSFNAQPIDPEDTYEPSQQAKYNLVEYVKQGLSAFQENTVRTEIEKINACVSTIRKPHISFAGQSDTGKSTLINALLGAEKMPAKWTPTTSIVVHIKHVDDRPAFISEDVWILGKKTGELWDDTKLDDEEYCKEFLIAKGDFTLLSDFGTHQGEKENQQKLKAEGNFINAYLVAKNNLSRNIANLTYFRDFIDLALEIANYKECLLRAGKSAALSISILVISMVAVWAGAPGIVVSIVAGVVMTGYSVIKIRHDKRVSKDITFYSIKLCCPILQAV